MNRFLAWMLSLVCLSSAGCSALGLSLYPSGHFLTDEAERVLEQSRPQPMLPRELAKTVLPSHAIQPGDVLLIEAIDLTRDLRLPPDQIVRADGTVDLGPYGRTIVAGMTLELAEDAIERQVRQQMRIQHEQRQQALEALEIPLPATYEDDEAFEQTLNSLAVNVRLIEPTHRYYVLGEVNSPGSFPMVGNETVLDAIVNAGGLTSEANPCKVLLARPTDPGECRITLPICYREIVQLGNASTNYQVRPGDRIYVASRSCRDEMFFWRASRTCSRCEACNVACRDASAITSINEFGRPSEQAIPPGSVGYSVDFETSQQLEAESIPSDPRTGTETLPPRRSRPEADVRQPGSGAADGELQFDGTAPGGEFEPLWIQPPGEAEATPAPESGGGE